METKKELKNNLLTESLIKIFECNGLILNEVAKQNYGVAGVFQKQKEFHLKNLTAEFIRLKALHENQSLDLIPKEILEEFGELKNQL